MRLIGIGGGVGVGMVVDVVDVVVVDVVVVVVTRAGRGVGDVQRRTIGGHGHEHRLKPGGDWGPHDHVGGGVDPHHRVGAVALIDDTGAKAVGSDRETDRLGGETVVLGRAQTAMARAAANPMGIEDQAYVGRTNDSHTHRPRDQGKNPIFDPTETAHPLSAPESRSLGG